MKGVAFDIAALYCGAQETQIKMCVVADQNGAGAAVVAHGAAHMVKQLLDRFVFAQGVAIRVVVQSCQSEKITRTAPIAAIPMPSSQLSSKGPRL